MSTLNILLLCWNQARYLEQCIAALGEQTSPDFEVIFLDNCSTDGSATLASELLQKSGVKHRVLENQHPAGVSANINRLFAASRAPLVSFLAADDWLAPRYVEAMQAAAAAYPRAGLFYSGGFIYHEEGRRLDPVPTDKHRSGDLYLPLLRREDPLFFVGTCCRRHAFEAIGGFDEQLQIEDLDFFVRLAQRYPIQRVDESLVYYRRSAGAVSSNIPWMVQGWEQFHRKHMAAEGLDMNWWMAETYRSYAAVAVDRGEFGLARRLLGQALRMRPFSRSTWRTLAYLLRSAAGARAPTGGA